MYNLCPCYFGHIIDTLCVLHVTELAEQYQIRYISTLQNPRRPVTFLFISGECFQMQQLVFHIGGRTLFHGQKTRHLRILLRWKNSEFLLYISHPLAHTSLWPKVYWSSPMTRHTMGLKRMSNSMYSPVLSSILRLLSLPLTSTSHWSFNVSIVLPFVKCHFWLFTFSDIYLHFPYIFSWFDSSLLSTK